MLSLFPYRVRRNWLETSLVERAEMFGCEEHPRGRLFRVPTRQEGLSLPDWTPAFRFGS